METTTVQIDVSELATGVILRRENRDSWSPLVEGDGNENEQESRSSICRALFPSNEQLMSEVGIAFIFASFPKSQKTKSTSRSNSGRSS
jgi:hypothetical protein